MKRKNLTIIDHPLAQDKLWHLRNKHTAPDNFRRLVAELSHIMAYEMTRDFKTEVVEVETPVQKTTNRKIVENMVLAPIMRAGQAMVDGMLDLMPTCAVGHIGIYRDKFINNTVEYYFRLPKGVKGVRVAVLDPLLATGDTAIAAVSRLKEYDVGPISFVALLVAEVGLKKFLKIHPDVHVYTLSVEPEVNSAGYILPGIGDAGDRIYGTLNT
ncbi:MAG: uracil phosphoribosyltransferase [Bdellovibrionales bacterium RBG_16_40_8]|nr:MAG: uracil phosphoribosyltransferase [Bdellovibrionales bacterium RBG_16_40_8]